LSEGYCSWECALEDNPNFEKEYDDLFEEDDSEMEDIMFENDFFVRNGIVPTWNDMVEPQKDAEEILYELREILCVPEGESILEHAKILMIELEGEK